jgi:hypothetical protein
MKRWLLLSATITIISGILGLIAYSTSSFFQLSGEYKKCDTYFQALKNTDKDNILAQSNALSKYNECKKPLTDRYNRNTKIQMYLYSISLPIFIASLVTTVFLIRKNGQADGSLIEKIIP